MNALMTGAVTVSVTLCADALGAQEASTMLTPEALAEIAQLEAEIDRIEAQTLERLAAPPDNQIQQIELLGKLMLYDKHLSVNRNEACAFGRDRHPQAIRCRSILIPWIAAGPPRHSIRWRSRSPAMRPRPR
jgi:cytochrome c peroxidase